MHGHYFEELLVLQDAISGLKETIQHHSNDWISTLKELSSKLGGLESEMIVFTKNYVEFVGLLKELIISGGGVSFPEMIGNINPYELNNEFNQQSFGLFFYRKLLDVASETLTEYVVSLEGRPNEDDISELYVSLYNAATTNASNDKSYYVTKHGEGELSKLDKNHIGEVKSVIVLSVDDEGDVYHFFTLKGEWLYES